MLRTTLSMFRTIRTETTLEAGKRMRIDFNRFDKWLSHQLWRAGVPFLRFGLGFVFVWFGLLKVLGASPATDLVAKTVYWFDPKVFVPILGWWEVAIGVCLAMPILNRAGILLLALQLPGTFLPLILQPSRCFDGALWNLTLEGQYIVKNLVIVGAALVLGGLVRGGGPSRQHARQREPAITTENPPSPK